MRLNCDLGEDYGAWQMSVDSAILPLLDEANVACGFHAGDPLVIEKTLIEVIANGLRIGAHPSYPDRVGFGRRHMAMEEGDLVACLRYQIAAINGLAECLGGAITYVKPHGALYNDLVTSAKVRRCVFLAVSSFKGLSVMVQAHPQRASFIAEAEEFNLALEFEGFIDRLYLDNGGLAPRAQDGAVLEPNAAIEQAQKMIETKSVVTQSGNIIGVDADTLCIHGDNPHALTVARAVRELL